MFTIMVKKRGKDEEFSFKDMKGNAHVVHEDCYGGKASWEIGSPDSWFFQCQRCGARRDVNGEEKLRIEITKTAIDGEERKISDDIRVIQKT